MKCIKLTYKSPLFGSVQCDEVLQHSDGRVDFECEGTFGLNEKGDYLEEFLEKNTEDLAQYAPDELKETILRAVFGTLYIEDYRAYLLTEVYVRRDLDKHELDELREWISGQLSDGWGESIEQQEVLSETVTFEIPEFNIDECCFDYGPETCQADYYIHPWSSSHRWELILESTEYADVDIVERQEVQFKTSMCVPDVESGKYTVKNVYAVEDAEILKEWMQETKCRTPQCLISFIEEHLSGGSGCIYYVVTTSDGLESAYLPLVGVHNRDVHEMRIYTINTINGEGGAFSCEELEEENIQTLQTKLLCK